MRIVSLLPSATEPPFEPELGHDAVLVAERCDFTDDVLEAQRLHVSPARGGSPAEIDGVVEERIEPGDDLDPLDRGAFAEIDPELVVTHDMHPERCGASPDGRAPRLR